MRIPSKKSFETLEADLTDTEWAILSGEMEEEYENEYEAFLVLTALRHGESLNRIKTVPTQFLSSMDRFLELLNTVSPQTTADEGKSFFWSIPIDASDEVRLYLTTAFLSYGQSFSSLLVSFRSSNSANLPDFVPVSWFRKFFEGEKQLLEEGIVLQADISMILFGYWTYPEVIDFLVRRVDLKEVTKLTSYGLTDQQEIAEMTELLPSEWLDDFFG